VVHTVLVIVCIFGMSQGENVCGLKCHYVVMFFLDCNQDLREGGINVKANNFPTQRAEIGIALLNIL
jgi:hypothetical protein